jgi:hypothetical protein
MTVAKTPRWGAPYGPAAIDDANPRADLRRHGWSPCFASSARTSASTRLRLVPLVDYERQRVGLGPNRVAAGAPVPDGVATHVEQDRQGFLLALIQMNDAGRIEKWPNTLIPNPAY